MFSVGLETYLSKSHCSICICFTSQIISNESFIKTRHATSSHTIQLTIVKYQIHWYYITRTTRQHGRAVLASKFFSADPSAPFAFVPHRSVVYSIRIWQHVHTISKRLTCYWQGHMMCGAAKGAMGVIHKLSWHFLRIHTTITFWVS
jgi:hypothetical protein